MSTYWLKYRGALIPLRRDETIVGRSPYCSIVVSSPRASRQHCSLRLSGQRLTVADLSSTNGTKVNGEQLKDTRPLSPGDVISIGNEALEVVLADESGGRPGRTTATNPDPDFEEDSTTETSLAAVDLITALAEMSKASPTARATAMGASIDALLERLALLDGRLSEGDTQRMCWAVTRAAEWFSDGSHAEWRDDLLTRIQGAAK